MAANCDPSQLWQCPTPSANETCEIYSRVKLTTMRRGLPWHLPCQEAGTGCDHGIWFWIWISPRRLAIWIWHTDDSCSSYGSVWFRTVPGSGVAADDACPLCAFDVWFINQFGLRPGQARPGQDRATKRRHNFLQMNNFCATHTKNKIKGKVKKQPPQKDWPQSSVYIFVAQLAF